jgi:drug/metabolite transporter (DMT)-like permease
VRQPQRAAEQERRARAAEAAGGLSSVAASVPEPPPAAPWRAQFLALAAIWGASFLFIKVSVAELAPIDVALGRTAIGAVTLVAILALTRTTPPRDLVLWGHLAVAGALFCAVPFALFAYGEERISSVLAGIWNATTPLLTVLVVLLALPQERPTRRRIAGLLIGFTGVLAVLGPWRGPGGGEIAGQLMCLGAAGCYALGFAYTRRFLAGRPEPGIALATGQLLCATAMLAVATVFAGAAPARALSGDVIASMVCLGALGSGIAYLLNYAIIRRAGATTASTVTYLIPLFSTVLGVAVLGEALNWNQPVGAVVVLAGVAVAQGLLRIPSRSPRAAA